MIFIELLSIGNIYKYIYEIISICILLYFFLLLRDINRIEEESEKEVIHFLKIPCWIVIIGTSIYILLITLSFFF